MKSQVALLMWKCWEGPVLGVMSGMLASGTSSVVLSYEGGINLGDATHFLAHAVVSQFSVLRPHP